MRRIVLVGLLVGLFLSGCGAQTSQQDLKPLPGNRIPPNAGKLGTAR
jgi:hypothetical protein